MDTPWSFLDPDQNAYELLVQENEAITDPTEGTALMIDVTVPRRYWPFPRRKTRVTLWNPKDRKHHLVALFVSPRAAIDYGQSLARSLLEMKNAQARKTTH